jgi:hypothetical protein
LTIERLYRPVTCLGARIRCAPRSLAFASASPHPRPWTAVDPPLAPACRPLVHGLPLEALRPPKFLSSKTAFDSFPALAPEWRATHAPQSLLATIEIPKRLPVYADAIEGTARACHTTKC